MRRGRSGMGGAARKSSAFGNVPHMAMKDAVKRLAELKARKAEMGGPERVERQRAGQAGRAARLELLFDPGTFEELGMLAAHHGNLPEEEEPASRPRRTASSPATGRDRRAPGGGGDLRLHGLRWLASARSASAR